MYHKIEKCTKFFCVYVAVKSNHDPLLVAIMAAQGSSFDCATSKEIKQVLDLGVGPERIIFANTVKPYSHIRYIYVYTAIYRCIHPIYIYSGCTI